MKALGIVRKLDELGRVVVPKEVRKVNGWEPGTSLEMLASEEGLFIREYQSSGQKEAVLEKLLSIKQNAPDQETERLINEVALYIKGDKK
ncbi:AbrB/MazE/SpoVT family DNA-binding domain-containing protein [Sediminibacillus halophilus]|uniref:AbrB family transcriptional regulator, stage V sporulation protein T n=1 Tax=Sediminibacillus halophilus TaxID=482461 RepID=A0A1G9QZ73_9BACI|nr:AbrB/MazE/SpoVT family DNA-binding domain-containing protein [Sediminibacillus halophilus]SDM15535.1 AbrB family transcriptional regulator, stage V sporulation protein T [Sediminibacillus halophilus]